MVSRRRGLVGAWKAREPRVYKTAPGYYGLGVGIEPTFHIYVQLGRWIFTTEPK